MQQSGGYEFSAAPRSVSTKRIKPQRDNGCVHVRSLFMEVACVGEQS